MVLQALADLTITTTDRAIPLRAGETVELHKDYGALAFMKAPKALRIVRPAPLVAGVEIRWTSAEGPGGPTRVERVMERGKTLCAVILDEGVERFIPRAAIVDIDTRPAIGALMDEMESAMLVDGADAAWFRAVRIRMQAFFVES